MVSCYAMGDKSKRTNDLHKNEGLKHASKTGKSDSAPKVLDDNSLILNPVLHVLCDTGNLPQGTTGLSAEQVLRAESKNVTVPFTLFLAPPIPPHPLAPSELKTAESRRSQTLFFFCPDSAGPRPVGEHMRSLRVFQGPQKSRIARTGRRTDAPLRERESPLPNRCRNARRGQVSSRRNTPGLLGFWTV